MLELLSRYTHWLHSRWPAGGVEKLPQIDESGCSNIPGFYIVGDLTGLPLLKFAADSGTRAVQHMVADGDFQNLRQQGGDGVILDVAIIGAGVSGMAAALAAPSLQVAADLAQRRAAGGRRSGSAWRRRTPTSTSARSRCTASTISTA